MNLPPPLPTSEGGNRYRGFARASWMSMAIALGFAIIVGGLHRGENPKLILILTGIIGSLMAIVGMVSGIVALFGIRLHGRKGILWPALIGIVLWGIVFAFAIIPNFMKGRNKAIAERKLLTPSVVQQTPVQHIADATPLNDAKLGISLDLPAGFEPFSEDTFPEGYSHAYLKPIEAQQNRVILVKPFGAVLPRKHFKIEQLPAGKSLTLTRFSWRGLEIDAVRVPEKIDEDDYLTFNVLVPIKGQAVQLSFGGPAAAEKELRECAEQVLSSVDGVTNW